MGKIDFKAINDAAINQLPSLLAEWLPGGKLKGKEYFACNPTRDDRHAESFSVNIHNGVWHDFASGDKGGDPISLYAFIFCAGNQGDAAKALADRFGIAALPDTRKPKSEWVTATPPVDPPKPPAAHYYRGIPDVTYTYLSAQGKSLGYVYRFTTSGGGKETLPITWCQEVGTGREGWHWKAFAEPRPLYGLDRLAAQPDATVLVVEGEKCADAAAAELPDLACVSWPGGGKAVGKADWQVLKGRKVVLWPDCDGLTGMDGALLPEARQPGVLAMAKVADKLLDLGCKVWLVAIPKPGEKPSGWDVADAVADGLHGADLAAYVREKSVLYSEKSPPESRPPTVGVTKRKDLEEVIDKTDDVDELIGPIVRLVHGAGLSKPAKDQLLGKIARKAHVSKQSLSGNNGGDDGDNASLYERILELNNRHAIVSMGGRTLILNRDYDPALKKNYFTFSGRHDFELLYCNQTVYQRGEPRGIGEVWIKHPARLQYEGITFQPGGSSNGFLNLWQGWGVEPVGGACDHFLEFVGATICSGDDALFDYIIKWCAHMVQRPHELPETALVMRGKEGAGKNRFAHVLGQIVGAEHFLLLTSMGQVSGRFSGHLSNALLVFCNEAVWGGDKSAQGVLKSMITDNVQPVEHKGRDISMVPNFKRLLMASNEDWVVPRGANDRHYVIIDVDDGRIGDFGYWQALQKELEGGCAAAFMRYLLTIDLTGWHPREIPQPFKERGWDLKIQSAGSVVQWWLNVLERGGIEAERGEATDSIYYNWKTEIIKEIVHDSYVNWATKQRETRIAAPHVVGKQLKKWGVKTRQFNELSKRPYGYVFPATLLEARKEFSKAFDLPDKVLLGKEGDMDIYD